jgi:hypothetical protein
MTATATARNFRSVSSSKQLIEAVADGYAKVQGFEPTSSDRMVEVYWASDPFGNGAEVTSLMRVSLAAARKLGLGA